MFDLNSLALKDTVTLQLRHPVTDELLFADEAQTLPISIVLYGSSSKQYRNAINAMQNRQLKRANKKASAEVMREEGTALLVACSESAINFNYKGAEVDNDATFTALYNDPAFDWLRSQVDSAISDAANFLAV